MSKKPRATVADSSKGSGELKQRLLFIVIALIVFRLGSFIPVPGVNVGALNKLLEQATSANGIVGMFNMFSGGALSRASIFALGIMPYISSSIITQLLTSIVPSLMELKKEGEAGRKKIAQYTRYGTLLLAIVQAVGISTGLPKLPGFSEILIDSNPGFSFYFVATISLVTGTMFLMWLGEQITERGVGNGISIIIFAGIVAGLPSAVIDTLGKIADGDMHKLMLFVILALIFAVTFFVVFVEKGQRRITINYAQRQQGKQMFGGQSTHLPLKINMAGVIPAIFASTIMMFPVQLATWLQGNGEGWRYIFVLMKQYFSPGQPLFVLLYAIAIIFFCFFYSALMFNPRETSDQLKKSGAFIPGIRPGEQTTKYIDNIMVRLTLIGGLYITFVCLIPEFMRSGMGTSFYFGGTSLLIVVVVIMDFIAQIQTLMVSNKYDSVLNKANLRNYKR